MKKVECFRSDNGHLEKALDRVKAYDLEYALPASGHNPNAKVLDWSDCLRIMENADVVFHHLSEYIKLRDEAGSNAPA